MIHFSKTLTRPNEKFLYKNKKVEVSVKLLRPVPIEQLWLIPNPDTESGLNHHVAMAAVNVNDIRGIPKRYEKELTYVTVEVTESPTDIRTSGAGWEKETSALLQDTVPHAMQAMLENLSQDMSLNADEVGLFFRGMRINRILRMGIRTEIAEDWLRKCFEICGEIGKS